MLPKEIKLLIKLEENLSEARANCLYYSLTYLLCVSLLSKSKIWTTISSIAIQWVHPFGVVLTFIILASEFSNYLLKSTKSGIKLNRIIYSVCSRYFYVFCSAIAVIIFMLFFSGALEIKEVSGEGQEFLEIIQVTRGGFGNYFAEIYVSAFLVFLLIECFFLKRNKSIYNFFNFSVFNLLSPILIFIFIAGLIVILNLSFFQFKYIAPLFIYFSLLLSRQCLTFNQKWTTLTKTLFLSCLLLAYIHLNFLQHTNIWQFSNLPKQNNYQAIQKACNLASSKIPVVTSYFLPDHKNFNTLENLLKPYIPKECNIFLLQKSKSTDLKCDIYKYNDTILFLHYSPKLIDHFLEKCGGKYIFSDYAYVITKL